MTMPKKPAALVLGAAFLWSTSYTVARAALTYIPPSTLALIRFSISAVGLGVLYMTRKGRSGPFTRNEHRSLLVCGLLGYTLYFVLQNWGLTMAYASDASLLVAVYPVITALIEWIFNDTRITPESWLGIGLAVFGVAVIVQPWRAGGAVSYTRIGGMGLIILTGVVWAGYSLYVKTLSRLDTVEITLFQTLYGILFILPLVVIERPEPSAVPVSGWVGALYLGVFCSMLAFLLYNAGVQGLRANQAVNILNTVPVFGVIIAAVFLGEIPNLFQVIGGLLVMAGVYCSLQSGLLFSRRNSETA